jgi:hypothetical protein
MRWHATRSIVPKKLLAVPVRLVLRIDYASRGGWQASGEYRMARLSWHGYFERPADCGVGQVF